ADWLRDGQARLVKQGPHRVVYRVDLPGLSFYVKRNLIPDIKTWLRQLVRLSKARMELARIAAVRERGILTVEPLALGEQQAFLGTGDPSLFPRAREGPQQLTAFRARALTLADQRRRDRLRKLVAVELGKLVARLHGAGIRHDDLHAANILIRMREDRPEL